MKWLLYIGGYAIFSSFVNILHGIESKVFTGKYRLERVAESPWASLLDVIATCLVWVWICWRFL